MHPSPALLLLLLLPLYAAAAAANNTNAAAAAAAVAPSSVPSLSTVRSTLANLEDSIIAALISRAKLPSSSAAVLKNWYGSNGDFIRYLQPFERDFAALGKYDAGTGEVPFTLAYPVTGSDYGEGAGKGEGGEGESFSVNDEVYRQYIDLVIPGIASFTNNTSTNTNNSTPAPSTANTPTTPPSPATILSADYALLSLLSRRVHYGKFVAEAKYASAPSLFTNLTDASRIRTLLTDTAQEGVVRRRTAAKAAYAGARLDFDAGTGVVDAGSLFGKFLIPGTTGVEVRWVEVRNEVSHSVDALSRGTMWRVR